MNQLIIERRSDFKLIETDFQVHFRVEQKVDLNELLIWRDPVIEGVEKRGFMVSAWPSKSAPFAQL